MSTCGIKKPFGVFVPFDGVIVLFDEAPFDEWKAFLDKHYGEPIGWDFHDRTGKPIMFVLARKDQPIEPINWDWDRSNGWLLKARR